MADEPEKPAHETEPAASIIREGELAAHVMLLFRQGLPLMPDCDLCAELSQRLIPWKYPIDPGQVRGHKERIGDEQSNTSPDR